MIEFRKDLFADERDDNLNEIGKPTQRQDMVGHVTGRSPYFDDHAFEGLLHLQAACAARTTTRASARSTCARPSARPGVHRVILAKDVPHNLNTLLSLMGFGLDDEPLLAGGKVRYKGEPVAAVVADSERAANDAIAKIRVNWEVLPHVLRRRGGAEARRAGGERHLSRQHLHLPRQIRPPEAALRRRRGGFAAGRPRDRERYQMSPIEQAPTETCGAIAAQDTNGASSATPRPRRCSSRSARPRSSSTCRPTAALHRRHGRRRLRRQGRQPARADGDPRLHADRAAGEVPVRPRRGDAGRRAARRRALVPQGRRRRATAASSAASSPAISMPAPIRGCRATRSTRAPGICPGPTRSPTSRPTSIACSPTARPRPPCAASASRGSISRSSPTWTWWRTRSA